jgi:hypothetical protein
MLSVIIRSVVMLSVAAPKAYNNFGENLSQTISKLDRSIFPGKNVGNIEMAPLTKQTE